MVELVPHPHCLLCGRPMVSCGGPGDAHWWECWPYADDGDDVGCGYSTPKVSKSEERPLTWKVEPEWLKRLHAVRNIVAALTPTERAVLAERFPVVCAHCKQHFSAPEHLERHKAEGACESEEEAAADAAAYAAELCTCGHRHDAHTIPYELNLSMRCSVDGCECFEFTGGT